MTKAVEVITSVQRRRRWSRGGEGTDCCGGGKMLEYAIGERAPK